MGAMGGEGISEAEANPPTAGSYEALDEAGRREFVRARVGEVVVHDRGIVVSPAESGCR